MGRVTGLRESFEVEREESEEPAMVGRLFRVRLVITRLRNPRWVGNQLPALLVLHSVNTRSLGTNTQRYIFGFGFVLKRTE